MYSLQDQFLQSLMLRYAHPAAQGVVQQLPQEQMQKFQSVAAGKEPADYLLTSKRILGMMHPSWYSEFLEHVPKVLHPLVSELMQNGEMCSPAVREFVLRYCINRWPEKDLLGPETIEDGELNWLLQCEQISTIPSLLGIYDLVDDIRQIVDKKLLQKVLLRLDPLQQKYLRLILHQVFRSTKPKIGVTSLLRENVEEGKKLLMQRGYERFARAIEKEGELFLWHFLHRLEKSQAELLRKEIGKEVSEKERARSKSQLLHAYQFLQRREKE